MAEGETRSLRQGSIVWARAISPQGHAKLRPLVILTPSDQIILDQPIVAVAVTTTYPDPPEARHVELPWSPQGFAQTGLRKRSAAVCDWLVVMRPSDVETIAGFLPTKHLVRILERIRALRGE